MNKKIILTSIIFLIVVALAVTTRFFGVKDELETGTVKAYFTNSELDPEVTCQKVFPVTKNYNLTSSLDPYYKSIEFLLAGPTAEEKTQGYGTALNDNVKIQSLEVKDGVARVDFNQQMQFQMGGSCRVGLIRLQIEQTLKQFPEVKQVIISVDGRTEDILQP